MRVTIELSDADAIRFIREHRGWIRWEHPEADDDAFADGIQVVEIDGHPAPEPPECRTEHRRRTRCGKRHTWKGIVPKGLEV